jgi:hypothetical protein
MSGALQSRDSYRLSEKFLSIHSKIIVNSSVAAIHGEAVVVVAPGECPKSAPHRTKEEDSCDDFVRDTFLKSR